MRHYLGRGELAEEFPGWEAIVSRETRELDTTHGAPHWHGLASFVARKPARADALAG